MCPFLSFFNIAHAKSKLCLIFTTVVRKRDNILFLISASQAEKGQQLLLMSQLSCWFFFPISRLHNMTSYPYLFRTVERLLALFYLCLRGVHAVTPAFAFIRPLCSGRGFRASERAAEAVAGETFLRLHKTLEKRLLNWGKNGLIVNFYIDFHENKCQGKTVIP